MTQWSFSLWCANSPLNEVNAYLDDFQVVAVFQTAFIVLGVRAGYGRHVYDLSLSDRTEALKWTYPAIPLSMLSLATSKIAICFLLLRIVGKDKDRIKRWFPYVVIVILSAVSFPSVGYAFGQCQPAKKWWSPSTPGHCQDPHIFVKIAYAHGG